MPDSGKKYKISIPVLAIHLVVWLALLIIPALLLSNVKFETGLPAGFYLISNLFHIALFYLNGYLLYPRLMTRKFWWLYFLILGSIFPIFFFSKLFFIRLVDPAFFISDKNNAILFYPPFPFLLAGFIFGFIRSRIKAEKEEKELKAEALASELKFLRSQISPHFLFNVMTNLVSLARQKADSLEPTLIRLSEMLRYMLYETSEDKFPISKEVEYLQNYVELQKMRFGDDVDVAMQVNGERHCSIEPMLLIPFVENAFKHGIGLVEKPFINILVDVKDSTLLFTVTNNYTRNNSKDKNSGIGLLNVQNRLKLLYGNRHKLSIHDDGELYTIELKLEILC